MKKYIEMLIVAMMFMVSCDPAFAGIGGTDDSVSGNDDVKGLWLVTESSKPSFFNPSIALDVVKSNGNYVVMILNTSNKKWTYGVAVLDSGILTLNQADGITSLMSTFTASSDTATFRIERCIVYEDELCAEPGTVVSLIRVRKD